LKKVVVVGGYEIGRDLRPQGSDVCRVKVIKKRLGRENSGKQCGADKKKPPIGSKNPKRERKAHE